MGDNRKSTKIKFASINIAKTIAFLGMSILSFIIAFNGDTILELPTISFLHGKFSGALFFLFGVSFYLMIKKYIKHISKSKQNKIRKQLIIKAIFLFTLGYFIFSFWQFDIIHIYSIFIIIGIFLMKASKTIIWAMVFLIIAVFTFIFGAMDFPSNWHELTNEKIDIFSINLQLKNLFLYGNYSIFPHAAIFIAGMWFGSLDLSKLGIYQIGFRVAFPIFLITESISYIVQNNISTAKSGNLDWLLHLFMSTSSSPALPLHIVSVIAFSLSLVTGIYLLKARLNSHLFLLILEKGLVISND